MARKVIFLDVDGVINSLVNQAEEWGVHGFDTMNFDPVNMKPLKVLVESTGAELILSSSWRHTDTPKDKAALKNLHRILAEYGLVLAGDIGPYRNLRQDAIADWLQKNPDVVDYVILDDVNDGFEGENLRRFVVTDAYVGLTMEDIQKAINILNNVNLQGVGQEN